MLILRKWAIVAGAVVASLSAMIPSASVRAEPADGSPVAAFVRSGDLWVKQGKEEKRLTRGEFVRNPRWSRDGRWIAYTRREQERELWVRRLDEAEGRLVSAKLAGGFQWAPDRNRLAYLTEEGLEWIDAEKPDKPAEAAKNISGFAWWPDGSGFVASTRAELLPGGDWSQVLIRRIPLGAEQPQALYALPRQSESFFAVGTSAFKWSADGRWMAFFGAPTASLSADANTLCVLSADGATFQKLDVMANNEQWFEWSEKGNRLAYIAGEGREATTNKRLEVASVPLGKPALYTPAGFVDQAFDWKGADRIVASRAAEPSQWTSHEAERPFPFLTSNGTGARRSNFTSASHRRPANVPAAVSSWHRDEIADGINAGPPFIGERPSSS
jgi:dipeptidyl aminopeptidase/acylaminoacyl peptidase